jgi:signal transduction histidine kinase
VKLGIAARITAIFGLGALVLSLSMGGLSYFTTRHFLLAERESAAQKEAFANATLVRSALEQGTYGKTQYGNFLASLDVGADSHSVLVYDNSTYSSSLSVSGSSFPGRLRNEVLAGTPASQTYYSAGTADIAVGVPIPSVRAAYFEVFSISDLDHTLSVLGVTLIVVGIFTTLLGTVLGRFASRRSLRPLAGVSRAAVAIASGQLDTRLDLEAADPDLEDLTASFNTMVDQLQVRIERETQFNSDVSHELRSPLTTLSNSLDVLEADATQLPERSQQALRLLGDDLRRFQRMVGDLLEMSRVDAGSVDVFLEEVNVEELVSRSVEAGVLHLTTPGPLPPVLFSDDVHTRHVAVDKRRFERVMANLIENAANYGAGATRITVDLSGDASRVEIGVEDAGPGINPLERERVFERFYRGSASGRRGTGTGTGLGLALVAEHVRLMGGQARVDDAPDGGARFVVTLPLLDTVDEEDEASYDGMGTA